MKAFSPRAGLVLDLLKVSNCDLETQDVLDD